MGGHSLGAYTAQLIGGARIQAAGREGWQSFADPRPGALLLMSPQGTGQQGLPHDSWATITRPIMTRMDRDMQGQAPAWRREPFDIDVK